MSGLVGLGQVTVCAKIGVRIGSRFCSYNLYLGIIELVMAGRVRTFFVLMTGWVDSGPVFSGSSQKI